MHIRDLTGDDTADALALYTELTFGPPCTDGAAFLRVLTHPGTTVVGAEAGGRIIGMITLHLLPNVTWDARPYALIENVVTAAAHRGKGIGRQVMQGAIDRAWKADAYKIMLLTGEKRAARGFYEALGFGSEDKTGMVLRRP
ncbi:GNAT family N-acetyltransferase [Sulfitobacter sp. JB4-11]|uniref:GNAT family N-acetyltransferase n=1 Tax=Sulfitobacter rhodophyticola TaxID=3238304 RepID=UPI0035123EC1